MPAWKRLGLKLKVAKEEVVTDEVELDTPASEPVTKKKRKRLDAAEEQQTRSTKKLKESYSTTAQSNGHAEPSPINSPQDPLLNTPKKTKSVKFTPETKSKDGSSNQDLYKAFFNGLKADDPNFRPEALNEALTVVFTPGAGAELDKPSKKANKKAKSKRERTTSDEPSTANSFRAHPAITYLLQHYQSREHWKFNKAKQAYLLKNLLNLHRIPAQHDKALALYVTGLQGDAVRTRVRELVEKVRAEDMEAMPGDASDEEDRKRRQKDYENALGVFLESLGLLGPDAMEDKEDCIEYFKSDEKLMERFRKRKRVEAVLWALSQNEPSPGHGVDIDHEPKDDMPNLGNGSARPRKRKLRTNAVAQDDESTASETSTESSSENTNGASGAGSDSESEDGSESDAPSSSSSSSSSSSEESSSESGSSSEAESSSSSESGSEGTSSASDETEETSDASKDESNESSDATSDDDDDGDEAKELHLK